MNDLEERRSDDSRGDELGPIVLDRLVDGQLDESQRRDLLRSLDHRPDGWRQCALAFLEAQSWGEALRGISGRGTGVRGREEGWLGQSEAGPSAASTAGQASSGARQIEPAPAPRRRAEWRRFLAMAGSFMLALSIGMYAQHNLRLFDSNRADGFVTDDSGPVVTKTVPVHVVQKDNPNGPGRTVQVPLVEASALGRVLRPQTSAMPEAVRQQLAQFRVELRLHREYWPVNLGDGKLTLVPVDTYQLVPIGSGDR